MALGHFVRFKNECGCVSKREKALQPGCAIFSVDNFSEDGIYQYVIGEEEEASLYHRRLEKIQKAVFEALNLETNKQDNYSFMKE